MFQEVLPKIPNRVPFGVAHFHVIPSAAEGSALFLFGAAVF